MTTAKTAARYVGQSVKRKEDVRLLTGAGRFVDDVQMPGMLHLAFLRSYQACGRITQLDTSLAEAAPGVRAVFTGADLNPLAKALWATTLGPPISEGGVSPYPPLRALADEDVRFVGDPVAVVVAEDRYLAEDALDLIDLEISECTPVVDPRSATEKDAHIVHPELGTNVALCITAAPNGELDAAYAAAAHVVTRTFSQARATNVPMEPRGIIAHFRTAERSLDIWAATQSSHEVKAYMARMLGIPEAQVRVVSHDVGGGFGQKIFVTRDEAAVVLAAFRLGNHPVKWIEDRRENLISSNQAREEIIEASMAFDADHRILAAKAHYLEDVGAYPTGGVGSTGMMAMGLVAGPYRVPLVGASNTAVYTNTCGRAPYRGPWMMETTAREQLIDHAAQEMGIDPMELRRINMVRARDQPYTSATGMVYENITPLETMEQALEILGYESLREQQATARSEGRLLGIGMSVYVEPSALAYGIMTSDGAALRMDPSGKVQISMGTGNHGNSLETTICQLVAEELGCDYENVMLVQGDTTATPFGPGTAGSRSAVIAGGAARKGAVELRRRAIGIAAHAMEASPEDMEIVGGVVSVRGTPSRSMTLAEVASTAFMNPAALPPGNDLDLEVTVRYSPPTPFTWSNAAHCCVVEVDTKTGVVTFLRYIVSEDCGKMINPMVVKGQIAGGVVQGIGGVLYEHMVYDDQGNPLATTFLDYLIPTAPEVPEVEYGHIETPSSASGGHKGMGEGGAIGAPAAVANAVHDAVRHLGVHPTDFPFSPSRLLSLLTAAESQIDD